MLLLLLSVHLTAVIHLLVSGVGAAATAAAAPAHVAILDLLLLLVVSSRGSSSIRPVAKFLLRQVAVLRQGHLEVRLLRFRGR